MVQTTLGDDAGAALAPPLIAAARRGGRQSEGALCLEWEWQLVLLFLDATRRCHSVCEQQLRFFCRRCKAGFSCLLFRLSLYSMMVEFVVF